MMLVVIFNIAQPSLTTVRLRTTRMHVGDGGCELWVPSSAITLFSMSTIQTAENFFLEVG